MSGRTTKHLKVTEIPVTEETYSQAAWMLRKCSSYTYCERMWRLYASFLKGYEAYAKTQPSVEWYMETLARLFQYQSWLEQGLRVLRKGDRSGYQLICQGADFSRYITGRRFSEGEDFGPLGERSFPSRHEGLYSWVYHSVLMAERILRTIGVEWTFERILGIEWEFEQEFSDYRQTLQPATIPPLVRHRNVIFLRRNQGVPICGIWQPTSVNKGCLNLLNTWQTCPDILVPHERIDDPPFPGGDGTAPTGPQTFFKYTPKPTEWQLVWEDRRYVDGTIPAEEAEYLQDPQTHFPNDAAAPVPPLT